MTSFHAIVNPAAGGGRAGRREHALRARLDATGAPYMLHRTRARGHAADLAAEAARAGASAVFAIGGDGTIHEVVNGLLGSGAETPPPLGIIPIGSGNDFVKAAGGETDPARLVAAAAHGSVRRVDVGRVLWNGRSELFTNAMGLGIDVEVVRGIERHRRLPGVVGYLLGLFGALTRYRPIPVEVALEPDGQPTAARILMLAVTNGHCIGGGFHVCPRADVADGSLDICLVRELGALGIARTLPRVLRGTHAGAPGVTLSRATRVEIRLTAETPLVFQLDGELRDAGAARSLRVEVLPRALAVLASAAARSGETRTTGEEFA